MSRAFLRYGVLVVISFTLIYYLTHYRLHFINLWAFLVAINVTVFLSYGFDKLLAKLGWLRFPEILLHIQAFFGGVAGALAAQQIFWHKTTKRSFQIIFWLIFVLQVMLLYVVMYTDLLKSIF